MDKRKIAAASALGVMLSLASPLGSGTANAGTSWAHKPMPKMATPKPKM